MNLDPKNPKQPEGTVLGEDGNLYAPEPLPGIGPNSTTSQIVASANKELFRYDKAVGRQTITLQGKVFPTYESSPVLAKAYAETQRQISAEFEMVMRGAASRPVTPDLGKHGSEVIVTNPVRKKYPLLYRWTRLKQGLRRLWAELVKER